MKWKKALYVLGGVVAGVTLIALGAVLPLGMLLLAGMAVGAAGAAVVAALSPRVPLTWTTVLAGALLGVVLGAAVAGGGFLLAGAAAGTGVVGAEAAVLDGVIGASLATDAIGGGAGAVLASRAEARTPVARPGSAVTGPGSPSVVAPAPPVLPASTTGIAGSLGRP